ncbi:MAG: prolipoprotein diacylglyceryl transferase [Gammaproteobacteria bacterium]|nr:prolipoprotein diacylglyceryl transferase [Gammaproteobacteria bacterium]
MLTYPHINPVILDIVGPLKIRWYGIMYLLGFLLAFGLALIRVKKSNGEWTKNQVIDLFFFLVLGVIIGGRLGYMLFYGFSDFVHHPWIIFQVWQGGMSFHGGLLGVLLMMGWWAHRNQKHFIDVTDFIAPLAPVGLAAGRLGNFINDELWGRVTHVPWGMIFPTGGPLPRHPSQIYEFLLEGILLFIILWFFSKTKRPRGAVSGLFLIGYGCARFFCEFFRQPDPQLGFIAFNWLTMGQLLCVPMILGGIYLLIKKKRIAEPQIKY